MIKGDLAKIKLPNGYETIGVIVRQFKNGSYGIRERNGRYYVRCPQHVTQIQSLPCPYCNTEVVFADSRHGNGLKPAVDHEIGCEYCNPSEVK